ncbi:MAG: transcription antitermination factor NusB [Candidatus Omnitrophota bacterium]
MRKRTKARQLVLQILYQMDVTNDFSKASLDGFWMEQKETIDTKVKEFVLELLDGIQNHLEKIDCKIIQYAQNWDISRMAIVDRNILRQACYELLYRQDIPPKVSINEAIDLAKRFSGVEAGKFVNGILDKIRKDLDR